MKTYVVAQLPISIGGKGQTEATLYIANAESETEAVVNTHAFSRLKTDHEIDEDDIFFRGDNEKNSWREYSEELIEEAKESLDDDNRKEADQGFLTVHDDEVGGYTVTSTMYSVTEMEVGNSTALEANERKIGLPVKEVGEFM